jgi:hypothetical protein
MRFSWHARPRASRRPDQRRETPLSHRTGAIIRVVISRLEAALSLAMSAMLVCVIAGWETAALITGVPFLALLVVFVARVIYRKSQGRTWDDALGRSPAGTIRNKDVAEKP